MIQSTSIFYQDRVAYRRTRHLGWLMGGAFLLCTLITFFLGLHVWGTYTHVFTFYLKWQDALVALLWFVTFLTLRGSVLVLRFQYAVHVGYIKGVFSLIDTTRCRCSGYLCGKSRKHILDTQCLVLVLCNRPCRPDAPYFNRLDPASHLSFLRYYCH